MQPNDGETDVWIDRAVQVIFSQPMNHASVEQPFSLRQGSADGPQVQGTFSLDHLHCATGRMAMGMTYGKLAAPLPGGGQGAHAAGRNDGLHADQLLERDTTYYAKLAQGAEGESGGLPTPVDYHVVIHDGETARR